MWQMKEWFLKVVLQSLLWRRRKGVYYAVSVVSIAANLVVLVRPSLQASLVLRSGVLQAAWSALPQVADVVMHRSVLYILLNLIVARIVVKSGMLGPTPGMPAKHDEFCPPSSYYGVRGFSWPPSNTYPVYGMQSAPSLHMFTDPSLSLQQVRGNDQNSAMVDVLCAKTPAPQHTIVNKLCDDKQPKCVPAPSLFTIEPLNELVQTTESYTLCNDQVHINKTLRHPLHKVASRVADLHRATHATFKDSMKAELIQQQKNDQVHIDRTLQHPLHKVASRVVDLHWATQAKFKDSMKAELIQQQKNEQTLQLVLAKQDVDGDNANAATEHDDNSLSRQEFNERVDTFIVKFKRNLTIQRQDSLNRLLGLVGGGGDIRLIK